MKTLLFAALLLAAPAIAAEMSIEDAWTAYDPDWPVCEQGTAYDGGPRLPDAEIQEACAFAEEAKNILLRAGLIEE